MIKQISSKFAKLETKPIIQYGLLVAITLLAATLRFYKLGEWSFWFDEIYTINHAQAHFGSPEKLIDNIPPAQNWISLSVILTAGVINILGISEWSARLASAVIGVVSVPALYFPIKRVFNPGVSLLSVLLLAVSPWHLYWSQNARFYTSLMLLYTLAMFAFYFGLERDRIGFFILFIFLAYFAASERLLALFFVPVVLTYLLLLKLMPVKMPPGLRFRNLFLILLPGIAIVIIELYSYISSGTLRFFGDFDWFLLHQIEDPLRLLSFIGFDIGVPLMCFAVFGGVYLLVQKSRAGLFMFVGAIVPIVLLLALNPFLFTKDRYVFITLPHWIILGAVGIRQIFSKIGGQGKILALGLLLVFITDAAGVNLLYYQVNNGNRRDWKGAFSLINEKSSEGDLFVSYWPQLGEYYLRGEWLSWEGINPEIVKESSKRYWFVLDSETIWTNGRMKSWVEQNAELIEVKYLRTPDDFSLRVYLYDPVADALSQ